MAQMLPEIISAVKLFALRAVVEVPENDLSKNNISEKQETLYKNKIRIK